MLILYCRVSTRDQTTIIQKQAAMDAGYAPDLVLSDEAVSGVSTKLAERPQGKRLFDILRSGDTLLVRWLDRLGRNYDDITESMRLFLKRGVIIRTIINAMVFDGSATTPMDKAIRDAMIGFLSAMAQAEVEARKEAQRTALERARQNGFTFRGRKPSFTFEQVNVTLDLVAQGLSDGAIAQRLGLKRHTVLRLRNNPAKALAALERWRATESTKPGS